jgi:hypothetical protein
MFYVFVAFCSACVIENDGPFKHFAGSLLHLTVGYFCMKFDLKYSVVLLIWLISVSK